MHRLLVVFILALASSSHAQEFSLCSELEDTEAFLECVGDPSYTDQYVEVPDVDAIKEDYFKDHPDDINATGDGHHNGE